MIQKARFFLLLFAAALTLSSFPAGAREIIDMTGHRVIVPDKIRKVYGTSPPATYMVYAMDPGLVAGLNFPLKPGQSRYMDPRLRQLPVIGGWFGQGNTANLETLLQNRPDLILVWRLQRHSAVIAKIDQALKPLNIPVAHLVMDSLEAYPAAFRFLGELFDLPERSRELSNYAEETLKKAARVRAEIEKKEPFSVYYAEGPDGLSTECSTSIHAELIPLSGGLNVHRCADNSTFGMQKISMEQVLKYNPRVIVSHEPLFFRQIEGDARWRNIRAVKEGRVYRIPREPFNWFDRPPSFMRLLGVQWMMNRLYPEICRMNLAAETRRFYRLFLNANLDEAAVRELLQP